MARIYPLRVAVKPKESLCGVIYVWVAFCNDGAIELVGVVDKERLPDHELDFVLYLGYRLVRQRVGIILKTVIYMCIGVDDLLVALARDREENVGVNLVQRNTRLFGGAFNS